MMASKRPEEAAPDTPRRTWRDPNVQLRSAHSSVTAPIGDKRRPTTAATSVRMTEPRLRPRGLLARARGGVRVLERTGQDHHEK